MKPYHRLESESDNAWKAFCDYLAMPPPRTVKVLHSHYTHTTPSQNPPPSDSYSTLRGWHYHHAWDERASVWDAEMDELRLGKLRALNSNDFESQVRLFRDAVLRNGKQQARLSSKALEILESLTESFFSTENLDDKLKLTGAIANLMRSIPALSASGFEVWAKALGIDRLLSETE